MLILVAFQALLLLFLSITSNSTRFPLFHRDYKLSSTHHHNDYRSRFEARMKRDAMRVASLTRHLATNEMSDLNTDLQYISLEYFGEVGVGTPPQTQTLVVDTGSNILWVQCKPCDPCYQQFDPVFDPTTSSSFADVGCDDLDCDKVEQPKRGCDANRCTYDTKYGDGTQVSGTMAKENITIGNTTVPNILIGCTNTAQGIITETQSDGILGLGGGSVSIVSQSGGLIGGIFSYCLGNSTSAGWMGFGRANVPTSGIKWASLIHNVNYPSYYYIDLAGLSVGGEALDIPGYIFQVNQETGEGGVILDTGTVVTRLPRVAYEVLRDKFKEKMSKFETVGSGLPIFDTCYNIGEFDLDTAPTVSYNFLSNGLDPASITLEARNVLVDDGTGLYCLAFAPTITSITLIGNMHQQGIQITIDAAGGYIGFGPSPC